MKHKSKKQRIEVFTTFKQQLLTDVSFDFDFDLSVLCLLVRREDYSFVQKSSVICSSHPGTYSLS